MGIIPIGKYRQIIKCALRDKAREEELSEKYSL